MRRDLYRRLDALTHAAQEGEFQRDVAAVSDIMDELSAQAAGGDPNQRQPMTLSDYMEGDHAS